MLGLLVVAVHVMVLSWLREQLPRFEPLASMAEPLFTRTLEPAAPIQSAPDQPAPAKAESTKGALQAAAKVDAPAVAPAAAASSAVAPETAPQPDQTFEKAIDTASATETIAAQAPDKPAEPAQPSLPAEPGKVEPAPAAKPAIAPGDTQVATPAPVPPSPLPDTWPAATRLSYVVTGYYRGDLHGSARVQWQREGDTGATGAANTRYQVQLDLYALGFTLFTMTSQGELGTQGLSPKVYEERRPGGARRVWFEGDLLRLDDGRKVPLPALAQDTASQFVELGHRFSTGREVLQVGREVAIWLARPGGVDLWTYDVVGEETLRAGELGNISAFRLKPRPLANPRGNVMAEIWFAPSLQFLPVRVRISMGLEQGSETFVDLLVERIEQAAK
jgi:hypothetical protein